MGLEGEELFAFGEDFAACVDVDCEGYYYARGWVLGLVERVGSRVMMAYQSQAGA